MKRPITVTMLVITVICLGIIAGARIPLDFMPPIELPFLGVFIPYPGATPAQVEQEIAIPAEGEFRTLSKLRRLYSNSSGDGCFLHFMFEDGVNITDVLADVRDRIERLRLDLPDEVDRVFIRHFSSDQLPVMEIGLNRPGDEREFAHLVRTTLVPRLQRLEGVAEVQFWGHTEESVMIEFDQSALMRHGLSIYQIVNTLQSSSINLSAGALPDGGTEYLVRTLGEFKHPREIAELGVGNGLKLKDVARVGFRSRDEEERVAIDGKKELFLMVTKESGANTVAVCDAVLAELNAALALPEFQGAERFLFFNQGQIIVKALDGLRTAGQYGGLLSLVVLFVFLGRLRPTVIVALAIPGSLVVGLVFMYFQGMTLNLVTMMSLIIAIGMVVDNAIVVVENIFRHRALGLGPRESAERGANEVALAITAATATTAVVFVPVLFLQSGQLAVFMRQFALPVSVALGASLLIALTVVPLAVSRVDDRGRTFWAWLRGLVWRKQGDREVGDGVIYSALAGAYRVSLSWTIQRRLAAVLLLAGIGGLTYYFPVRNIGLQAVPDVDRRAVDLQIDLDPSYDLARATEVFDAIEAHIAPRRDELGIKNVFKRYGPRGGSMQLFLIQKEDLADGQTIPYTSREVMQILSETLPARIPGGAIRLITDSGMGGGPAGGAAGQATLSLQLRGDDARTVEEYAERFAALMRLLPGITEVDTNIRQPDREIQLNIDEQYADAAGVSPMIVARTVSFALIGTRLPEIKSGGREVPVWAQFREEDRKTKANLDNVMVMGGGGSLVPLNRLVDYARADSPRAITRMNGKNYVSLTARTASTDLSTVRDRLHELVEGFELPPGYSLSFGDELVNLEETISGFVSSLVLAIVLIYVVMGALFESWLLPLSILTTVPLASVGVLWVLYLTNTPLDTVAFIGCILMVGIIVNNGIVIIDYINNVRRNGADRFSAVMQAGRDRLRPVLMTALTTILAAVPLALGRGMGDAEIHGLGRALIGGLITGTVLTLYVVPLFYTLIDDVQWWVRRYLAAILSIRQHDGLAVGRRITQ